MPRDNALEVASSSPKDVPSVTNSNSDTLVADSEKGKPVIENVREAVTSSNTASTTNMVHETTLEKGSMSDSHTASNEKSNNTKVEIFSPPVYEHKFGVLLSWLRGLFVSCWLRDIFGRDDRFTGRAKP